MVSLGRRENFSYAILFLRLPKITTMKNTTRVLFLAGIIISAVGCSKPEGKKTEPIVTPVSTKISEIVYSRHDGRVDSFHIDMNGGPGNQFNYAGSDSLLVDGQNGSGTGGSSRIEHYYISGTSLNPLFKGSYRVNLNYYTSGSQTSILTINGFAGDTSNHVYGSCAITLSSGASDTLRVYSGSDTIVATKELLGAAVGSLPVDYTSLWVLDCAEKLPGCSFDNSSSYFMSQNGPYLSKTTYYKNHVIIASYTYSYVADSQQRIVERRVTDRDGNVDIVYYRYK